MKKLKKSLHLVQISVNLSSAELKRLKQLQRNHTEPTMSRFARRVIRKGLEHF